MKIQRIEPVERASEGAHSPEVAKACSLILGAAAMVCVEAGYSDEEALHALRMALAGTRRKSSGSAH